MRTYSFYQLDVFTDRVFAGNAPAVFPEDKSLSVDEMQQIAREMNLSETVLVFSSEKALCRGRMSRQKRILSIHARFFAPDDLIAEDAAPLAGCLINYDAVKTHEKSRCALVHSAIL